MTMSKLRHAMDQVSEHRLLMPWRYRKHLAEGRVRMALAVRGAGCRVRYGQR